MDAEFAHDKFLRLRVDLSHNMGAILGNSTPRTRVERRAVKTGPTRLGNLTEGGVQKSVGVTASYREAVEFNDKVSGPSAAPH